MRIIAGKYRGRTVKFPNSKAVRPTTDKVKESLFNYLFNQIDFNGIFVCDIYAGSGSLGLEALSRGASEVHFVEQNFKVFGILKENIAALGAEESCKVFKSGAVKFTKRKPGIRYDLILADPPFFRNDIHDVLANLLANDFLNPGGRIIIERSVQTEGEDASAFGRTYFKKIGDSLIYQFIREE